MNRMFCLVLALGLVCCAARDIAAAPAVDSKSPARCDLPPQIVSFIAGKEAHARELARKLKLDVHEDYWTFFGYARSGDWPAAERLYESLLKRTSQDGSTLDPRVVHAAWQTVTEVIMALEAYCDPESAPKWSTAFGEGIVKSIPRGSIYFGGTDPGRGLPTAFPSRTPQATRSSRSLKTRSPWAVTPNTSAPLTAEKSTRRRRRIWTAAPPTTIVTRKPASSTTRISPAKRASSSRARMLSPGMARSMSCKTWPQSWGSMAF